MHVNCVRSCSYKSAGTQSFLVHKGIGRHLDFLHIDHNELRRVKCQSTWSIDVKNQRPSLFLVHAFDDPPPELKRLFIDQILLAHLNDHYFTLIICLVRPAKHPFFELCGRA